MIHSFFDDDINVDININILQSMSAILIGIPDAGSVTISP